MKAREAIQKSGLTVAQLARDASLSEAAVWAWLKGARSPSPDSIRQLVTGLRHRGDELHRLAEDLEK